MNEYYHTEYHHFHTLGLSHGATIADIKKAYRSLAMKYHPDVNPSQEAKQKFQRVVEAYDHLLAEYKLNLAQTYVQASIQYQTSFEQVYQSPSQPVYTQAFSDVESGDITVVHRVVYVFMSLITWGVSLFFIALPVFAGYLMIEKGFSGWEGAIMSPLSLAGMLVIWRTVRHRKEAFA